MATGAIHTGEPPEASGQEERARNLNDLFHHAVARRRIEALLPKGVTLDTVLAEAELAARDNPELLRCTGESLLRSTCRILQWGLQIGVTAYLVPYNTKVPGKQGEADRWEKRSTAVMGYTGLAELLYASGMVRGLDVKEVYAGDKFSYRHGLDPMLEHEPCGDPAARGAITYAYAIIRLPHHHFVFDVMSAADIDAIRQKFSKQWKGGALPYWYAQKTVLKRAAKLLPKSPQLRAFFSKVGGLDEDVDTSDTADAPDLGEPADVTDVPPKHQHHGRQVPALSAGEAPAQPIAVDPRQIDLVPVTPAERAARSLDMENALGLARVLDPPCEACTEKEFHAAHCPFA